MTTRFAPVAPVHILQSFADRDELGDYHLLLAHDIVKEENRDGYRKLFGDRDWEGTVILDNSIIELGNAVHLDIIRDALEITRANVVVLPDVLLDGEATYNSIMANYDNWYDELNGASNFEFMLVPQGKTVEEFRDCVQHLDAEFKDTSAWWGIPRNTADNHGTRSHALMAAKTTNPTRRIHLLGFSENLHDDIRVSQMDVADGIDSAVPVRIANCDPQLNFDWDTRNIPPRGDWWEKAEFNEQMLTNLQNARRLAANQ